MKKRVILISFILCSIFLSILILGCYGSKYIPEVKAYTYETSESILKTNTFVKNYDSLALRYVDHLKKIPDFEDRTVDKIKLIFGLDGEAYTVVECLPTGYIIYNFENDLILEFAANSTSPYKNKSENLIYLGPTYYFQADEAVQVSKFQMTGLLSGEKISLTEKEFANQKSNSYRLSEAIKTKALQIKAAEKTAYENNSIQTLGSYSKDGDWETWWLDNPDTFRNLTDFGYVDGGYCGYIAGAMNIYYFEKHHPGNFMFSSYLTQNGFSDQLTHDLIDIGSNLGYGSSTAGGSIKDVVDRYLANYSYYTGINYAANNWVSPFWSFGDLRDNLMNNYPVYLFGNYTKPVNGGNHAVIAYGSRKQSRFFLPAINYVVVHFGWSGYNEVTLQDFDGCIFGTASYIYKWS